MLKKWFIETCQEINKTHINICSDYDIWVLLINDEFSIMQKCTVGFKFSFNSYVHFSFGSYDCKPEFLRTSTHVLSPIPLFW